jgi:hypothetical protein
MFNIIVDMIIIIIIIIIMKSSVLDRDNSIFHSTKSRLRNYAILSSGRSRKKAS